MKTKKWKILAPMDLSVDTRMPVAHALDVAGKINAELTLLYVSDDPWYRRARRLGWLGRGLAGIQSDTDVHRLILPGAVPQTVGRYAELMDADIIVMTARKLRWWTRLWKRSVVDGVMKATERPVMVSHRESPEMEMPFRFRQILCLLNLDGTDEALLLHAQRLVKRGGGALTLLGVVPEASERLLVESNLRPRRPLSRSTAAAHLEVISESLPVPHKTLILTGAVRKCLHAAVRAFAPDLVMVSRGTTESAIAHRLDTRLALRTVGCTLLSVAARPSVPAAEDEGSEEAEVLARAAGNGAGWALPAEPFGKRRR